MEWSEELTLHGKAWIGALEICEVSGCRPNIDIRGFLDSLSEREGYLPDKVWPTYLAPQITDVDEEFGRCLAGVLRKAVQQWRDPSLGLRHPVNGAESPFLSKGGICEGEVNAWERIAAFAEKGAFKVSTVLPGIVVLRR